MAATNSRYKKRTSRQRLRRGCQLVAPGGKMLDILEQAFQQQGHQQLPVQPGAATVLPAPSADHPARGSISSA